MDAYIDKDITGQINQWLHELVSGHESEQDVLRGYIGGFNAVPDDQKQDRAFEMLNWMSERGYVPYDLDIPTTIELINILIRYAGHHRNAMIMLFLLSHQNFLLAGPVDKGFIANEMILYLLYYGDMIMDTTGEIQNYMVDDPMFDILVEASEDEDSVAILYPNIVAAFLPAYLWLKDMYPHACYDIPEEFIETIQSCSDSERAFRIYSSFCRYLHYIFSGLQDGTSPQA